MEIKICGLTFEVKGVDMTNSGGDGIAKPEEQELDVARAVGDVKD